MIINVLINTGITTELVYESKRSETDMIIMIKVIDVLNKIYIKYIKGINPNSNKNFITPPSIAKV